jgi:cytochrome c oxidase assembly protein subunit 15
LSRLAGLLLLALGVQISLGIGNVVFHLPLLLAVAHNAGGALLLLTLVLLNYRVRSPVIATSTAKTDTPMASRPRRMTARSTSQQHGSLELPRP